MGKIKAAKGMVVNVSSGGYVLAEVDFEDPHFQVREGCSVVWVSASRSLHIDAQCRTAKPTILGKHTDNQRRRTFSSVWAWWRGSR